MKRVLAACVTQTLHFTVNEKSDYDYTLQYAQNEIARYKDNMDRRRIQYKIVSEEIQEDGSIIMEIKKQYNVARVGNYLD